MGKHHALVFPVQQVSRGITGHTGPVSRGPVFAVPVIGSMVDHDAAAVRLNGLAAAIEPDLPGAKLRIGPQSQTEDHRHEVFCSRNHDESPPKIRRFGTAGRDGNLSRRRMIFRGSGKTIVRMGRL